MCRDHRLLPVSHSIFRLLSASFSISISTSLFDIDIRHRFRIFIPVAGNTGWVSWPLWPGLAGYVSVPSFCRWLILLTRRLGGQEAAFYRSDRLPHKNWWEYCRGYSVFISLPLLVAEHATEIPRDIEQHQSLPRGRNLLRRASQIRPRQLRQGFRSPLINIISNLNIQHPFDILPASIFNLYFGTAWPSPSAFTFSRLCRCHYHPPSGKTPAEAQQASAAGEPTFGRW